MIWWGWFFTFSLSQFSSRNIINFMFTPCIVCRRSNWLQQLVDNGCMENEGNIFDERWLQTCIVIQLMIVVAKQTKYWKFIWLYIQKALHTYLSCVRVCVCLLPQQLYIICSWLRFLVNRFSCVFFFRLWSFYETTASRHRI